MIRNVLEERGNRVLITHYGDLVKYICRTFFDWNGEKDRYGRTLLQYVGTDVVRKENENYWVDFVIGIIQLFGDNWDYVVIPDCRFPNEVERLKEAGLDVHHLRVIRKDFESSLTEEQKNHPSETSLDDSVPDALILNSGSIEHLERLVEQYLEENIYGHEDRIL